MAVGPLGLLDNVNRQLFEHCAATVQNASLRCGSEHGGAGECLICKRSFPYPHAITDCLPVGRRFQISAKVDGFSIQAGDFGKCQRDRRSLQTSEYGAGTGQIPPTGDGKIKDEQQGKSNKARIKLTLKVLGLAACFGGIAAVWRAFAHSLPPDFLERWRRFVKDIPDPKEPVSALEIPPDTVIFDRQGTVIATISAGGYRGRRDEFKPRRSTSSTGAKLLLGDVPCWLWQAVVASEDRRFFEHHGVDPRGLTRAVLSGASRGGGSTITQQLVKNVFLSSERKWTRKLSEMILALVLEKQMSKWDILHSYLKKIYWGHGVYGIEEAAALYFGKHPSLLTLGECAMLAGIIPAPEYLSPYHDSSRGRKPQARALRRMVEVGFLDPVNAAAALDEPLVLAVESTEGTGTSGPWKAPYFVSEVLHELTQKYGWEKVACGGLQVHTTLDLRLQLIAEKVVQDALGEYDAERIMLADQGLRRTKERLESFFVERAEKIKREVVLAVRRFEERARIQGKYFKGNVNGEFLENGESLEGSVSSPAALAEKWAEASVMQRHSTAEKYLTTTLARYEEEVRSAAKSKIEAAMVAIDPLSGAVRVLLGGRDYYESSFNRSTEAYRSPGSTFKPVVYLTALAEGLKRNHILLDEPFTVGGFTPENYDRKFVGKVTLEESLLYSLNVPTVRLCAEVGVEKVCEMGKALGIETSLPYELAISLGGFELTPMQLATVYATIASGGTYHKPHLITRVESANGAILEERKTTDVQARVVSGAAVAELRALLQDVVERGTGRAARFGRPCAGKTGTSDDHRDLWFAGFTPELACVLWLGYDNNAPVGGMHPGTGASHAAPIWQQFMRLAHEGLPLQKFHDVGTDKHGGKAHSPFEKRTRRQPRLGLRKMRNSLRPVIAPSSWKQVWDWEKATVYWEEKEKMETWLADRSRKFSDIKILKRKLLGLSYFVSRAFSSYITGSGPTSLLSDVITVDVLLEDSRFRRCLQTVQQHELQYKNICFSLMVRIFSPLHEK
ncbi:hypothetical protein R1sor_010306 [Riccia sorocarpa]|uniref:peptidoglycan glycosyltransferase n=1 Tax=Riccia sorocarpa TaxID=122646 RepID=A0ABD3I1J6_9MARC